MATFNLPALYSESGLTRYLSEINKFPMLSEKEEYELALNWYEKNDLKSAHKLITSHLRMVTKVAIKFSGYGLPLFDLISEGNLGLMHALKKFDPLKGNRFSTYAVWWIKAYIQDYVLKSWSMVKIGTSSAKKKLFYNLNKLKNKISTFSGQAINTKQIDAIAEELDVSSAEVREMDNIMNYQSVSLNDNAFDEEGPEFIDLLPDTSPSQETLLLENDEIIKRRELFTKAFANLNEREQDIINERMLKEKPTTLEVLSTKYNVSCERIRQIEANAFNKLKNMVSNTGA